VHDLLEGIPELGLLPSTARGRGGLPGCVIVATPNRVGENVISAVYLLELLRARGVGGIVVGDPVRVGFKGRTADVEVV